jgi:FkbM family methyltransferase
MSVIQRIFRFSAECVVRFAPLSKLASIQKILHRRRGFGFSQGVRHEVAIFLELLGPSGGVVLDVGANVGEWSAAFHELRPDSTIHAFEPSSVAFASLEEKFRNRTNVQCHQLALGKSSGTVNLWADCAGSSLASLTKRNLDHFGLSFSVAEKVEITTADSFCAEKNLRPSGLKIDVEGHELDVLEGAGEILGGLKVIQFEFGGTNIDSRTYFQDFFYFLRPRGFRLWRLAPSGLIEVSDYSELDEIFHFANYFATKP